MKGNVTSINPDLLVEEQTGQLSYDERWEFPRYRLKLGTNFRLFKFFKIKCAKS